jgi:hypothetical protein
VRLFMLLSNKTLLKTLYVSGGHST